MKCLAVLCALWLSVVPTLAAPLGTTAPAVSTPSIQAGDTLDIQVAGETGLTKSYTVDAAGRITMDMIGQVRVAGRTPNQVEQDLRTRLALYLTRPSVIVTSSTPLRQEVLVTGEVLHQGPVKLRPGDGLLDALGAAGGIAPTGDAARATLVRRGQSQPVPLQLDLLMKGDLTRNLSLNDGDIIQIPKREIASYQVLGSVKLPGTKPMEGPTRVLDALLAAGGLSDRADRNRVTLARKGQAQPMTIDLDQVISGDSGANMVLQADDVLTVAGRTIITVTGEVRMPGMKLLRNGGTLMEAVTVGGGFAPDADRASIQVTHSNGVSETFSLADVTTPVGGPVVHGDDMITVGHVKPQFIVVTGAVRNSGPMPYRNGLKVTDVLMAASLLENAKWKEIRVIRGEDGPNHKILPFNLEAYLKTPQTENLALLPGDQVFVEASPRRQGPSVLQRMLQVVPLASLFFRFIP